MRYTLYIQINQIMNQFMFKGAIGMQNTSQNYIALIHKFLNDGCYVNETDIQSNI